MAEKKKGKSGQAVGEDLANALAAGLEPVILHPDKWPIRATGIFNALTGILEILEVAQPIVKDARKKDPILYNFAEAIHRNLFGAMAFLTLRGEAIEGVITRNQRGEYFKEYLKGPIKETLEEWAKSGYDTSIYKARPDHKPRLEPRV